MPRRLTVRLRSMLAGIAMLSWLGAGCEAVREPIWREAPEDEPLRALLVYGATHTIEGDPGDVALERRLGEVGFLVERAYGPSVQPEDARGMAVVVISSSVESDEVGDRLAEIDVPVVLLESWLFNEMRLTGPIRQEDTGTLRDSGQIEVERAEHPLAAGRAGTLTVFSSEAEVNWGRPLESAIVIARRIVEPTQAALFGYERGARLASESSANARRVAFFLRTEWMDVATDDTWDLFDAAVVWAADDTPGTP